MLYCICPLEKGPMLERVSCQPARVVSSYRLYPMLRVLILLLLLLMVD